MKCHKCRRNMLKIDRRNEIAEFDEEATDGQIADYFAAELSGDNGAWNLGIIEYQCSRCSLNIEVISDQLPSYNPLIRAWHDKGAEGDCFARFVFQYLSFIAHIKNNLFYDARSDREAIQSLKRDNRIRHNYLALINQDEELEQAWTEIIDELKNKPLHNSSFDPDYPEIDKWWNIDGNRPITDDQQPMGIVKAIDDWVNMVEFWYSVRNNLFHGGKDPNIGRDIFLVDQAFITLRPLVESEISS